jgi:hypothetical protein
LGDDADLFAQFTNSQRGLERVAVVDFHTDDRDGVSHASLFETFAAVCVTLDVDDSPVGEQTVKSVLRVVLDDHDRGATEVKLLHDTKSDAVQTAHDDVPAEFAIGRLVH